MYRSEILPSLKKDLAALSRKDPVLYEAAMKKITQISQSGMPHHYKNLRHDMKRYKRAHVKTHFVLLFRVDENEQRIVFEFLEHHGTVYNRSG